MKTKRERQRRLIRKLGRRRSHRSGTTLRHFHSPDAGYSCVAHGRRRHALMPPWAEYASPTEGAADWWAAVRPALRAEGFPHLYECVQAAGDLLFVPTSWHHSAVNERLTAAVSVTIGAPLSWQEIFRRHPE